MNARECMYNNATVSQIGVIHEDGKWRSRETVSIRARKVCDNKASARLMKVNCILVWNLPSTAPLYSGCSVAEIAYEEISDKLRILFLVRRRSAFNGTRSRSVYGKREMASARVHGLSPVFSYSQSQPGHS